jgi:hypothetical protein
VDVRAATAAVETALLVDGHVHFYRAYDRAGFFDSALDHTRRGAGQLGLPPAATGCLLFAEARGEHWFDRFRDEAGGAGRGWTFDATAEEDSLVARRGDERLFLIAGRQIATREGIEVLALATGAELPDRLPLADTLEWARDAGALAVLPWGFGKWWGARGAAVRQALRRAAGDNLFLGDSGGRPQAAPAPRLLREAAERRIRVLPGSDPLPLPGEERRAGSYGFVLRGPFDASRPAASVRRLVTGAPRQPAAYGRRTGLFGFAAAQLTLRRAAKGLGRLR